MQISHCLTAIPSTEVWMYKNSQVYKNLKLRILEFELIPLTKSFVQKVPKNASASKEIVLLRQRKNGKTHHASFTNVLSG